MREERTRRKEFNFGAFAPLLFYFGINEVVENLFIYSAFISVFFFIFVLAYTLKASKDYRALEEYAKSLSQGKLQINLEGV